MRKVSESEMEGPKKLHDLSSVNDKLLDQISQIEFLSDVFFNSSDEVILQPGGASGLYLILKRIGDKLHQVYDDLDNMTHQLWTIKNLPLEKSDPANG